jgi:hypothetical protein
MLPEAIWHVFLCVCIADNGLTATICWQARPSRGNQQLHIPAAIVLLVSSPHWADTVYICALQHCKQTLNLLLLSPILSQAHLLGSC